MRATKLMQCSMMQDDCRAAKREKGALMCTALNDTNFGVRPCPFYKPQWAFDYEVAMIGKGKKGFTPIVIERG